MCWETLTYGVEDLLEDSINPVRSIILVHWPEDILNACENNSDWISFKNC